MKVLAFIKKAFAYIGKAILYVCKTIPKIWVFTSRIMTISVIAFFVILALIIIMPDNAIKAIEILKSIF
jgi:hypothetical protein